MGQAKHTAAVNAHYSEVAFSSTAKTSILSQEIERLKKLKESDELDFYILFSNRRLGGTVGPQLEIRVAGEVGLEKQNVHFVGIERSTSSSMSFPTSSVSPRSTLSTARFFPAARTSQR